MAAWLLLDQGCQGGSVGFLHPSVGRVFTGLLISLLVFGSDCSVLLGQTHQFGELLLADSAWFGAVKEE